MSRIRLSRFVAFLAASGLLLGIAATAHAKLIGFNGTLTNQIGSRLPIVATGSGNALLNSSAGIGGHLTTLQILANTISVTGVTSGRSDRTPTVRLPSRRRYQRRARSQRDQRWWGNR